MGRLSRILKVPEKPKEGAPSSLEPVTRPAVLPRPAADPDAELLARLVACWPKLPPQTKQAIRSMVQTVEATK